MFWPFNKYPGSDYETFNYDWIIRKLKELKDSVAAAKASEDAAAESAEEAHGSFVGATIQATRAETAARNAANSAREASNTVESIADVTDQVAINTGRIDTLIANAGDTDNNAELLDIRIGFDGATYPTAGDAVRGQVDEMGEIYNHYINGGTIHETLTTTEAGSHRVALNAPANTTFTIINNSSTTITVNLGNPLTENSHGNLNAGSRITVTESQLTTYFRYWIGANQTVDITIEMATPYSDKIEYLQNQVEHDPMDLNSDLWDYGWSWYYANSGYSDRPWQDTSFNAVSNIRPIMMYKGSTVTVNTGYKIKIYGFVNGVYDPVNFPASWTDVPFTCTEDAEVYISIRDENNADVGQATIANNAQVVMSVAGIALDNSRRLDLLENAAATVTDFTLPAYWTAYLDTKLSAIRQNLREIGTHGAAFYFITDCHLTSNEMNGVKAIKYIKDRTNVERVINGGDFINDRTTAEEALAELDTWATYARALDMRCMKGNHDLNNNDPTLPAITNGDFYAALCRPTEKLVDYDGHIYGYEDDDNNKIRFIYLDTGAPDTSTIDNTQLQWMKTRITELGSRWTVVVFAHQMYATDGTFPAYDSNGQAIVAALNDIYNTSQATIAGVICGHSHTDYVDTRQSYPIILTTCDARLESGGNDNRPVGTVDEQAFDIFYINTSTQKFKTVRIGYGTNREVSY